MHAFVLLCALAVTLNNVQAFMQSRQMYGQSMGPLSPVIGQSPMTQQFPMQMLGLRRRGRSRNSFKRTPSYLGAKSLGCVYGLDNDSLLAMMMPRGCTAEMDFCPYKYPGRQCKRVGRVGMCCPFYVTPRSIAASAGLAQMRKVMEMLS